MTSATISNIDLETIRSRTLTAVQAAIDEAEQGDIVTNGDAFDIARAIAVEVIGGERPGDRLFQFEARLTKALIPAYSDVQALVARQLTGMTYSQVIDTVTNANSQFRGLTSLETVPKPTLAYTGECELHDPWNLYCNSHRSSKAAKGQSAITSEQQALALELKRADQLLLFIVNNEVDLDDIRDKPFSGRLKQVAH